MTHACITAVVRSGSSGCILQPSQIPRMGIWCRSWDTTPPNFSHPRSTSILTGMGCSPTGEPSSWAIHEGMFVTMHGNMFLPSTITRTSPSKNSSTTNSSMSSTTKPPTHNKPCVGGFVVVPKFYRINLWFYIDVVI
jgi:hypothetical protein